MQDLYKKASGTFTLKLIGLSIAFVFQIILGRVLNPELYGEYTMYLTYSSVFSIITVLGMDRNLIREVVLIKNGVDKERILLKFSLKTSFLIMIILSVILLFTHRFLGFSNYGFLLLITLLILKSITAIFDGFLQGKGLVVKVTLLNAILNNMLKMIFFVLLVLLDINSLVAAVFSFIISAIITIMFRLKHISLFNKSKSKFSGDLSLNDKKLFIKYSLTVALISGIGLLLQNIDKIMISSYLDLNSVGIYKVAQNYVKLISVFVTPFIAFWPMISKLYHENNNKQIEIEMKKIVRVITYLVIPMFFIFLFLDDDLLRIFGDAYVTGEAKLALIILSFSFLIDAISGPIGSILTMTKYAKLSLYNNIASLVINVVLNIILIRNYGIVGVAIATGASIIANNLISIIQVKVLLGIFAYDYKNLLQVLLLLIINYFISMGLINWVIVENLYVRIIIFGIIIYTLNLILLIIVQRKNIKQLILDRR